LDAPSIKEGKTGLGTVAGYHADEVFTQIGIFFVNLTLVLGGGGPGWCKGKDTKVLSWAVGLIMDRLCGPLAPHEGSHKEWE
jgi:hypothetical protein